MREMILSFIF